MGEILSWLSENVVNLIIAFFAYASAVIAALALYFNSKQTKATEDSAKAADRSAVAAEKSADMAEKSMDIAEDAKEISKDAKDASLRSAKASEDSAETARIAVEEGFRPLIMIYTIETKRAPDLGEFYEAYHDYTFYQLYIRNIGNRQCQKIDVTINPPVLDILPTHSIVDYKIRPSTLELGDNPRMTSVRMKSEYSIEFLNVNQSICLNIGDSFIATKNIYTLLTFTVSYKDLAEKPYVDKEFSATLKDLMIAQD